MSTIRRARACVTPIAVAAIVLLIAQGITFAQESDDVTDGAAGFDGGFDEGFGQGFGDGFESDEFDDRPGDGGGDGAAAQRAATWSGALSFDVRSYGGITESDGSFETTDDPAGSYLTAVPEALLDFSYESGDFEGRVAFRYNPERLEESDPQLFRDLVTEAYIRYFGSPYTFLAGTHIVIWGTGDEDHVVDPINPQDRRDPTLDYDDRRLAVPMIRMTRDIGLSGIVEVIYVPTFTADLFPSEGVWRDADADGGIDATVGAVAGMGGSITEFDADRPDTGQLGVRYRHSFAGLDLGFISYFGYLREVNVLTDNATFVDFTYDRINLSGIESSGVFPGGFTWRAEAAYTLTEDTAGDDPDLRNNRLGYLFGIDRDLGVGSLNAAVQVTGRVVLCGDDIEPGDVDYRDDERYTSHIVSFRLTDSYVGERVEPEVLVLWDVENESFIVEPRVVFSVGDDLTIEAYGAVYAIGRDDSVFAASEDRDHLGVLVTLDF